MGNPKSRINVDFYINLFRNVLKDAYDAFPEIPRAELTLDMRYVERRVSNEGLKFFTVALPKLAKAVDKALETSELTIPDGFSRKRKHGVSWNIPTFLSALFLLTFDSEGKLRRDKVNSVAELRQVLYLLYKVEMPFSPDAIQAAEEKFKAIDGSLAPFPKGLRDSPTFRYARLILAKLFRDFNPRVVCPRHGPGAVSEKLVGREKYEFSHYSREIDRLYPYFRYVTYGILSEDVDQMVQHINLGGNLPPSRVCFVPKDSRGPRTIAAEPALLMFLQQGLGRAIVDLVESHPETKGRVFFTSQQVHRDLALHASVNRKHATLDLKDASDRVSLELVEALFPEQILPFLKALRSRTAALPSGEEVELRKFAPMGSALCFPIEALTFFALASGCIWSETRYRRSNPQPVFVYGDDLVVPTRYAEAVISQLEQYGVLFNRDKCCIRGEFRESCGMDAFKGTDVTPLKLKVLVLEDPCESLSNLVSLNENANAFFDRGYWSTAAFLDDFVERQWGVPLPTTVRTFAGLSKRSTILPMRTVIPAGTKWRYDRNLQRIQVRTLSEKSREVESKFPTDIARLGHNLEHGVSEPYDDMVAVPHSARPKVMWRGL